LALNIPTVPKSSDRVDFSSFAAFKKTIEQIDFSQFLFGYDN